VSLDGPTTTEYSGTGRCILSVGCEIQVSGESFTLGGLYLTDLAGNAEIHEGCSATCHGCFEAAAVVAVIAQLVLQ
jgi:hypothetical protein